MSSGFDLLARWMRADLQEEEEEEGPLWEEKMSPRYGLRLSAVRSSFL